MDANELLEKNELVVTVDGELRCIDDCLPERRYDYNAEKYVYTYYDGVRYVKDYDGNIIELDGIEDTHFRYKDEWYSVDEYAICENCGNVRPSCEMHETVDTHCFVCEDCGYTCNHCGDWYEHSGNLTWVESEGEYYCDHCRDDSLSWCEVCNEYYIDTTYIPSEDIAVCNGCLEDHYVYCEGCGEYVHQDDWDSECDCCTSCAEDRDPNCGSRGFHFIDYSSHPAPVFYGRPRKDKNESEGMGCGFELEITTIDGDSDATGPELVNLLGDRCYYKRDASCHADNYRDEIEIIGQPMTYDYFMKEFPWEDMCNIAKDGGYVSHDYHPNGGDSCGFHLHFSREYFGDSYIKQTINIAKLLMFFAWTWKDLVKASRRTEGMLHWTKRNVSVDGRGKYNLYKVCREQAKNTYFIHDSSRYVAVNLTNRYTVEIRLCRGSLNSKALKAWGDLMFAVVKNCRELPATNIFTDPQRYLRGITQETRDYLNSRKAFLMGHIPTNVE